jgi:hypothetical protein
MLDWPVTRVGPRQADKVERMNLRDRIGRRGESPFKVIIGEWCNGRP